MIRLLRNVQNTIAVKVDSFVAYDGFSATLVLPGSIQKQISDLAADNNSILISSSDISAFGADNFDGVLTVYNEQSEAYSRQVINFSVVDSKSDIINFQTIMIVLVQEINKGGGGDAKIKERLTTLENKNSMMGTLSDPKQSIQACQTSITSMLNVMRS